MTLPARAQRGGGHYLTPSGGYHQPAMSYQTISFGIINTLHTLPWLLGTVNFFLKTPAVSSILDSDLIRKEKTEPEQNVLDPKHDWEEERQSPADNPCHEDRAITETETKRELGYVRI